MQQPGVLTEFAKDKHLLGQLSDSLSFVCFQMQGTSQVAHTGSGTGPGDPLADLMFNLAFKPAMHEIATLIQQENKQCQFPAMDSGPFTSFFKRLGKTYEEGIDEQLSTAFVDDLAVMFSIDISVNDHQQELEIIPKGVHSILARRGLIQNFSKSAFMLCVNGPGADCYNEQVRFSFEQYRKVYDSKLLVLRVAEHLGGLVADDSSLGPDISAKIIKHSPLLTCSTGTLWLKPPTYILKRLSIWWNHWLTRRYCTTQQRGKA